MSGHLPARGSAHGATQATLRSSNLRTVLRVVLAADEPLTRGGVAAATGMTRSTATRLVDLLVEGGLLAEGEARPGKRPGRPGIPVTAASRTVGAVGLQLNAARAGARLVDLRGDVVAESVDEHVPASCGADEALAVLRTHVGMALAQAPAGMRIVGGALSLPGVVDAGAQRVLAAPHLGWSDLDLGRLTDELLPGLPVQVRSEAHHAARAVLEPRPGRAGGVRDGIVVYGDVGLGAALVLDGAVREAGHGVAGALGHVPYRADGPVCACGERGCLEAVVGRLALVERAGLEPGAGLEELARLARQDHEASVAAVQEAGTALGTVLATALALTDTTTVVLAGELGRLTDLVRPHLVAAARARGVAASPPTVDVVDAGDDLLAMSGGAVAVVRPVVDDPTAYLDTRS